MSDDDDLALGATLAAQEKIYNAALDTDVTQLGVDWLARAHLLLEIANDDVDTAKAVVHTAAGKEAAAREFESLDDDKRNALGQYVCLYWGKALKEAVQRLWHAA